jgi:hypothetical protein
LEECASAKLYDLILILLEPDFIYIQSFKMNISQQQQKNDDGPDGRSTVARPQHNQKPN